MLRTDFRGPHRDRWKYTRFAQNYRDARGAMPFITKACGPDPALLKFAGRADDRMQVGPDAQFDSEDAFQDFEGEADFDVFDDEGDSLDGRFDFDQVEQAARDGVDLP